MLRTFSMEKRIVGKLEVSLTMRLSADDIEPALNRALRDGGLLGRGPYAPLDPVRRCGRWLAGHPCWHVHFTPTGTSSLDQVFALLTEKQLRCGVLRSTQKIEQAIRHYINAAPRPFSWTKSAGDILATIKRFCLPTLDTAERQKEIITTSESGH